ncbi:MAG: hypothetical protein KKF46_04740 [Nanoarchaeota archaeon]|nr:hypothetical protein [Nanoarchaeota archaeon]MBU1321640.1 hypothetical protein [Nanoarchaeota archaeon]MBU1597424.1 hypothetical protein [Nanoarchaeota archaeon]MBU2440913.1 hypothetical protein [Nanoarchaeota archaeon]
MKKQILVLISIIALLLLVAASNANALTPDYPDIYPIYNYYDANSGYDKIPIVTGPFPRGYLWYQDTGVGCCGNTFLHDDFNHYDEFVGYKDLDVYYPGRGGVDIYRNPQATQLPSVDVPEGWGTFGKHVYGFIPGDGIYRKHYDHEHPWDVGVYQGYGYAGYTGCNTPPPCKTPCQSKTLCQARRGC